MYGNKGSKVHVNDNHALGVSLLCVSEKKDVVIKKWIIIESRYLKKLFGNSGNLFVYNLINS